MDDNHPRPTPTEEGGRRRFVRPWEREEDSEEPGAAASIPADDETEEAGPAPDELPEGPTATESGHAEDDAEALPGVEDLVARGLDDFTHEEYLAATTREYQDLAEAVAQANTEEFETQAVAAPIAGVGTGLVGFEDVTGKPGVSEEEVEAVEQARTSDLALRVGSAVVLVGLFLGSLLAGGVWFTLFVTVLMVVAAGEFYGTLRSRGYAPVALFGFAGLIGAAVGAHLSGPVGIGGLLATGMFLTVLFYTAVPRRRPLENAGLTILGMLWSGLLAFAIVIGRSERAVALILLVVILTAFFDIAAYFVGRGFGRRPLAPRVSPKKTVEGLIGGVVLTLALAAFLSTVPLFDPLDLAAALVLGIMVAVLGPLGDAAESVVKRSLGVKDMGAILPGHGGILDRIDAFLFVVPASYLLFQVLGWL